MFFILSVTIVIMKKIIFVGFVGLLTFFVSNDSVLYAKTSANNNSYIEQHLQSKNGGDISIKSSVKKQYKTGDVIKVNWTSKESHPIAVALVTGTGKSLPTLESVNPVTTGSSEYSFSIDNNLPSGNYFVLVFSEKNVDNTIVSHFDSSKTFSIKTSKPALVPQKKNSWYEKKEVDTAIITILANMRATAELYYDSNAYSYKNLCKSKSQDRSVATSISGLRKDYSTKVNCVDTATEYAIEAKFKSENSYYCVDSTGAAGTQKKSKGSKATVCKK